MEVHNPMFPIKGTRPIKQIKKMGPLSEVMGMIPGANKLKMGDFSDKNLKWVEAIISSMTFKERINPGIINSGSWSV